MLSFLVTKKEYCVNMSRELLVQRIGEYTRQHEAKIEGDKFYIIKARSKTRMRPVLKGKITETHGLVKRVNVRIAPAHLHLSLYIAAMLVIVGVLLFAMMHHVVLAAVGCIILLASQLIDYYVYSRRRTELRRLIEGVLLDA